MNFFSGKNKNLWIVALLIAISFFSGIFITRAQQAQDGDLFSSLRLFSEVLSIVKNQYVEEIDTKKLINGSIKGMISVLNDPHTHFMEQTEYKNLQVETKGSFGGLGIEIDLEPITKQLIVVAPMEGTPAERVGIKAGDKIVEIEGKSTTGITLKDAIDKLRGPKDTAVTITVKREGVEKPLKFTIIRDIIKLKAVRSASILKEGIGYMRLTVFNQNAGKEIEDALNQLQKKGMKSLILDLRNNPGGLLDQAIEVSNKFISKGVIVSTKGRTQQEVKYFARPEGARQYFPLIILVNQGSASASEIVTGAVKDNKRGLIMGTKTFGKGSVQSVIQLEDGAGIAITTAKYYTPSGVCIHGTGISPDIEVEDIPMSQDPEELEFLHILNRNNCFIAFAQKVQKTNPDTFSLNDENMEIFSEILKSKNIDFTRQKLVKYKNSIENMARIEIARLSSDDDALRYSLFLDPVIKKAYDVIKGAELLRSVSSNALSDTNQLR